MTMIITTLTTVLLMSKIYKYLVFIPNLIIINNKTEK